MIRDLTEGRPFRVLLLFSLPMFFSMLFQQIYNLADSLIAGRFISEAALGAVGTCYPVTVIFIAIASGLLSAAAVYAAFMRCNGGGAFRVRTASGPAADPVGSAGNVRGISEDLSVRTALPVSV